MKKHYRDIDILKGLAIAMVLLGHSIIVYPINLNSLYPWCNYLHYYVSSAHLPLFFMISGFCFSFQDWKSYLVKKSRRIIIPYLVFAVISALANMFFGTFINEPQNISLQSFFVGLFTGQGNWFLYTLFVIFLIFPFFIIFFKNTKNGLILIGLLGILQLFNFWPTLFRLDRVTKYVFYFAIGYFFKQESKKNSACWQKTIELIKKPAIWIASLIIWIPLVSLQIVLENRLFLVYSLESILTAIIGIINIISFGFIISRYSFSKLFEDTGKVSLQLFLFNGYLLTITRTMTVSVLHITSPIVIILANFCVMYFLSYAFIHFVVMKVKLFRVLTGAV